MIARRLTAVLVAVLMIPACASADDRPMVLVASSLMLPVTQILADGGLDATLSEGASQVLAAQARDVDAHLVLLADPEIGEELARDGGFASPIPLVSSPLAIAVAPGALGEVTTLTDLADPDLVVVLADLGVPLRTWTDRLLARELADGVVTPDALEDLYAGVDSFETSAALTLAKVASGEADAAIVYATAASGRTDDITFIPLRADMTATSVVLIRSDASAADRAVLDALLEADETWLAYGFTRS